MVRKSYSTIYFLLVTTIAATALVHLASANDKPVKPLPYTAEQLLSREIRDTCEGDSLGHVAFPLGGIGTGCISLAGTGRLTGWEIFNKENRRFEPLCSFLSVWAKAEGEKSVFKVLEGTPVIRHPYSGDVGSLPRMRRNKFVGRFPFAKVYLEDKSLPLDVVIEGWSPFTPGNDKDSSIPVAIVYVTLHNTTQKAVEASLGINLQNRAGNINEVIREPGFCALYLHDGEEGGKAMVIATTEPVTTWQTHMKTAEFACVEPVDPNVAPVAGDAPLAVLTAMEPFLRTFVANGRFDNQGDAVTTGQKVQKYVCSKPDIPGLKNFDKIGSVGVQMKLEPGEKRTVPLVIGWYFPVFDPAVVAKWVVKGKDVKPWRNYYAVQWPSGLDVARYVIKNLKRLDADTRLFQETFFSSTLPGTVLKAVSSNMSVLRTPAVIRYPDGNLYGWESRGRIFYGNVNHVWHYAQVLPYLFPKLQRSILENFYFNSFNEEDGAIQHRIPLGPGAKAGELEPRWRSWKNWPKPSTGPTSYYAAADGQFGMICHVYRDWQQSGDDAWLKKMWPRVKKSLEYAWVAWDKDRDGLLESPCHTTLDFNLFSPDFFCGSLYQAALLACERMALYLGDKESAQSYRKVFESGKKLTDQKMFNGEYYQQILPISGDLQLGKGCTSEQVHGQLYSRMFGLDDVFDGGNIHKALASVFKYNYMEDFYDFVGVCGWNYGDDKSLLIATWPRGGRPENPLPYSDITAGIGFEAPVAANLIYDGYMLEGLTVIKSICERTNGKRRNPYSGNARSMALYSSLLSLSGWRYSAVEKTMWLAPQLYSDDFRVFFSVNDGWGTISQKKTDKQLTASVEVAKGKVTLDKLVLCPRAEVQKATAKFGTNLVKTSVETIEHTVAVKLVETVEVTPEQPLTIKLTLE